MNQTQTKTNFDKTYLDLLQDIQTNGYRKGDRTGTGTTSVYGRQIRFDLSTGHFPLLTTKKLHTKSIIHELLWFLNGDTNTKYLNDNGVTIWNEWADDNGDLGPVYGKQWVDWNGGENKNGINQIQFIIDRLKSHPDCRRIIVNAWNVAELSDMNLMPCHYGFQFWTRELSQPERWDWYRRNGGSDIHHDRIEMEMDKENVPTRSISLMWNQRSVDTLLGLPFNIASYAFLLNMVAQQVNMIPGELIGNLGDTHIYSNHIEYVSKQLERDPFMYEAPKLNLKKANDIFSYKFEDFEMVDYQSYPNWKNVLIAI